MIRYRILSRSGRANPDVTWYVVQREFIFLWITIDDMLSSIAECEKYIQDRHCPTSKIKREFIKYVNVHK